MIFGAAREDSKILKYTQRPKIDFGKIDQKIGHGFYQKVLDPSRDRFHRIHKIRIIVVTTNITKEIKIKKRILKIHIKIKEQ